jgi:hypothetical protein
MMRFILVMLSAFALAGPAEASRASTQTITTANAVAEQYWADKGLNPCEGPIEWRTMRASWNGYSYLGPFEDWDPHCLVVLNQSANWKRRGAVIGVTAKQYICGVVVHEHGHLVGRDHVPTGVMAPVAYVVPRRCRLAFPAKAFEF